MWWEINLGRFINRFFGGGHYREWRRTWKAASKQEKMNKEASRERDVKQKRGPQDPGLSA